MGVLDVIETPSGVLLKDWLNQTPKDDGANPHEWQPRHMVESLIVENHGDAQESYLRDVQYPISHDLEKKLREIPTILTLHLKDLRPHHGLADHVITIHALNPTSYPAHIDVADCLD